MPHPVLRSECRLDASRRFYPAGRFKIKATPQRHVNKPAHPLQFTTVLFTIIDELRLVQQAGHRLCGSISAAAPARSMEAMVKIA
jgi:hypothetical protein